MKKRLSWFKSWGIVYLPISWQGISISLLTLAFCVQVFIRVDQNFHSVSDTLYGIFPYIISALIVLYVVAILTSSAQE